MNPRRNEAEQFLRHLLAHIILIYSLLSSNRNF